VTLSILSKAEEEEEEEEVGPVATQQIASSCHCAVGDEKAEEAPPPGYDKQH